MIIEQLRAGRTRKTLLPEKRSRNGCAVTMRIPIVIRTNARPKLNATRIRRPKVILLIAIASKSRIKASGHGTIPPENPMEIRVARLVFFFPVSTPDSLVSSFVNQR